MFKLLLSLLLLGSTLPCVADPYLVYLADKNSANQICLSIHSQLRRNQKGLNIDVLDLAINHTYLQSIASKGIQIIGKSRWLNAVLIEGTQADLQNLYQLKWVSRIEKLPGNSLQIVGQEKELPPGALLNNMPQLQMLDIDLLHLAGYTGKGVTIAVFDNGFTAVNELGSYYQLFEEQRLLASRNFVSPEKSVFELGSDGEHGSRVLSVLAAVQTPNFIGAAFEANYILAVTEDMAQEGILEEWNWLMAAEWADSIGADIISSSLGYATNFTYGTNHSFEDLNGKTTIISKAANLAASRGILVVNSAGNEGDNKWRHIIAPADADSCLAIGAVDEWGNYVSFSSQGPSADMRIKPNLMAMGSLTITVLPQGYLKTGNGTSFACPLVSGLAACLWQANPNLSNMELFRILEESGSHRNNPDSFVGYGVPSGLKAYEKISGKGLPDRTNNSNYLRVFPNPGQIKFQMSYFNYGDEFNGMIEIYDAQANLVSKKQLEIIKGYQVFDIFEEAIQCPQGLYYLRVSGVSSEIIFENKIVIAE